MLQLKGLSKRYATGDLALNNVDLEVPATRCISAGASPGPYSLYIRSSSGRLCAAASTSVTS